MKALSFILGLVIIGTCMSCKNDDTNDSKWEVTWKDDFSGAANSIPDPTMWESLEYNRRNNDSGPDGYWDKDNVFLDGNGNLKITVNEIPNKNGDSDTHDYSTGMVRSRGKFEQKFGRFEASCKLPAGAGWWVAFWLFTDQVHNIDDSGEDGTEIDIMEGFGWTDRVQSALHYDGYFDDHEFTSKKTVIPGIRDGFHTYALEWSEDEYVFFVDDVETWRTTYGGVSKAPSYVKLTGEISSESWAINNGWSNAIPDDISDEFLVDYVKVYKLK